MKSMTGFGSAEEQLEGCILSIEIKGYNHRFLDIAIILPSWLGRLEHLVRSIVATTITRGKITVTIHVEAIDAGQLVTFRPATVKALADAMRRLMVELNIEHELRLEHLLGFEGVITVGAQRDIIPYQRAVEAILLRALQQFELTRANEGAETKRDIMEYIGIVEDGVAAISHHAKSLDANIVQRLRDKFALLGAEPKSHSLDGEITAQLVRFSINEELMRMQTHLALFRNALGGDRPSAKRLDFICQELGREINAIASKNLLNETGESVIDIKEAIENIREQLRNVE